LTCSIAKRVDQSIKHIASKVNIKLAYRCTPNKENSLMWLVSDWLVIRPTALQIIHKLEDIVMKIFKHSCVFDLIIMIWVYFVSSSSRSFLPLGWTTSTQSSDEWFAEWRSPWTFLTWGRTRKPTSPTTMSQSSQFLSRTQLNFKFHNKLDDTF